MYIKLSELKKNIKATSNTIYKLIKEGMPFIKVGKDYRFEMEEVDKWLKERSK